MPVQLFTLFYDSVVKTLQQPPFNWIAGTGYELAKKYKEIISQYYQDDKTPLQCAEVINNTHLGIIKTWEPINFTNPIICKRRIKI
jgi:hypothetical protein